MFLDINKIGSGGLAFDETLSLSGVAREHPDVMDTPTMIVTGTVHPGPEARTPAEGARLSGEIRGVLRLRCSRCLEQVDLERRIRFDLTLVGKAPGPSDSDHKIAPRETRFFELCGGKLDLGELTAEQVYLDLPAKPVCRPDCAGLCPTCGNNRNHLECGCREPATDRRWAALQAIRDKMGG